jgi:transcriptional regulator with XRE-family HTH domain
MTNVVLRGQVDGQGAARNDFPQVLESLMPKNALSGLKSDGRPNEAHEMLGRQLRSLRNAKKVPASVAGRHIGASASKISRMEGGRTKVKDDDLYHLLTLYGVTDPVERQAMLEFACALNNKQWWDVDKGFLGGWFCSYLTLESISQYIRTYEVRFIPGLLQTEAYAEAVIRRQYTQEAEIRRRVRVRMRRQQMVLDRGTTRLWALVDSAALDEGFAGTEVMRKQIEFLIYAAQRDNVMIQVLPSGAGGYAGVGNSFSILRLRVGNLSDVVYLEHIDDAFFHDDANKSDPYRIAMTKLALKDGTPEDTMSKLEKALAAIGSS